METNTFVPHENKSSSDGLGNWVVVISIIIFVLSIAIGGGSYFLRKNQEVKTKKHEDTLTRSKERFESGIPIRTLQQFDLRLRSAKELLSKHKSFAGLFPLIEKITLKDVQFTSFTYNDVDNGKKNSVQLIGRAPNYKAIAEQSEQFSNDEEARRYITDVVFSNLSVDPKNNDFVNFEVRFQVDPEFLVYNRYITLPNTKIDLQNIPDDNITGRKGAPNVQNR